MSDSQQCQRLYDRSPELVQAVKVLTLMPDEVRSIVSEGILTLIQEEFKETMREKHYRSIGCYKILGLHKTQNRRRAYDQNPILRKAISRLYILSDSAQDTIGKHIVAILEFIQRYFEDCTELQQQLSLEDIAAITNRYIENGSEDVDQFLKSLRNEFHIKLHGYPEPVNSITPQALPVDIASNRKGMKINTLE